MSSPTCVQNHGILQSHGQCNAPSSLYRAKRTDCKLQSSTAARGSSKLTNPEDLIVKLDVSGLQMAPGVCSMLELPLPEVNELGRPEWSCSAGDVSRAFRRISVLVHPDKNPQSDARIAFEALSAAHRQLRDPGLLVSLQPSWPARHACDTISCWPSVPQTNRRAICVFIDPAYRPKGAMTQLCKVEKCDAMQMHPYHGVSA